MSACGEMVYTSGEMVYISHQCLVVVLKSLLAIDAHPKLPTVHYNMGGVPTNCKWEVRLFLMYF
jgi:succinate dehydrogenase/fumarate reductase flavoprotein subunit